MNWRRVIIESPYAGDTVRHLAYLRACTAHCLRNGEAPFASHGLYAHHSVANDDVPEQRAMGIDAGFAWGDVAHAVIIYVDLGWSAGMREGLRRALERGGEIRTRTLGAPWSDLAPSDARFDADGVSHG